MRATGVSRSCGLRGRGQQQRIPACGHLVVRPRSMHRRASVAKAQSPQQAAADVPLDDAILLTWLASKNKSLFAAKCLVETVLECYRRGYLVDDLQVSLQMKVLQSGTDILDAMDQDVLLSWIMLTMSTLQQLGLAVDLQPAAAAATADASITAGPSAAAGSTLQAPTTSAATPAAPTDTNAPGTGAPPAPTAAAGLSAAASAASASATTATVITQRYSSQVNGLLQYVKNTLNLYKEQGYTLARVQSLQATVNQDQGGRSQFLELMQQYTRLVLITIEVVAAMQLPVTFELSNPSTLTAPSGYTASVWPDLLRTDTAGPVEQSSKGPPEQSSSSAAVATPQSAAAAAQDTGSSMPDSAVSGTIRSSSPADACQPSRQLVPPVRAHAVRLLMAWMGAVLGSSYSRQRFVAYALECYESGISANSLFSQIAEEEYYQTGGLIPVPGPKVMVEVNGQLFGQWLSCCYMSWAQLGVPFPQAEEQTGWAWAGGGEDAVTANALAAFTAQTIRRLEMELTAAAADPDGQLVAADLAAEDDPLAAKIKSDPQAAASLEAASAALTKELLEQGLLRGRPLPAMVKVSDDQLSATSSALLVWRQLLEVVQDACTAATAGPPTAND